MAVFKSGPLLIEAAKRLGYAPTLITDYGVFSLEVNKQRVYFYLTSTPLNSAAAERSAKDKHTTHKILDAAGIVAIPYIFTLDMNKAADFLRQHQKIVYKPVLGMRSRGVEIITDERYLRTKDLHEIILEKFVSGTEFRYLIINGELCAVRKMISPTIYEPVHEYDPYLESLSIQIAQIMQLGLAAVDFIVADDQTYVLEVNSTPGISTLSNREEIAEKIIQAVVAKYEKS